MFSRFFGVFTGRGRRVPRKGFTQLTSKLGPKGYYRGKGVPSVGHHTRKGEAADGAVHAWSTAECQSDQHLITFLCRRVHDLEGQAAQLCGP
jgi:hypothetical protein